MTRSRLLAMLAGTATLAAAFACAGKPREKPIPLDPIETGAGTVTQARKFLQGRWSLQSFEVFPPGGKATPVSAAGTLTYDDFGNLAIEIRADEAGFLILEKTGIPSDRGVLSSTGRVVLDMQRHTLTYVIEAAPATGAATGPLAMNRPRHWEVEGDRLTLTTKDDAGRPTSVGIWQRAR
jgi:hypothetical protein